MKRFALADILRTTPWTPIWFHWQDNIYAHVWMFTNVIVYCIVPTIHGCTIIDIFISLLSTSRIGTPTAILHTQMS